jgi:hypothetical protein
MGKWIEQTILREVQIANKYMRMFNIFSHQSKKYKLKLSLDSISPFKMAIIKKTNNKDWQGYREKEPSQTVSRLVSESSHYGNKYGDSYKKNNLKIEVAYYPAMPPRYIPEGSQQCTPWSSIQPQN